MKAPRYFLLLTVFLFSSFALVGREEVRLRSETRLCCELPRNFQPRQFANDASGATYVTGYTYTPPDDEQYFTWDILTFKFDSAGRGVWTNRYNGFNQYDDAAALALDGSGNVLVVGASETYRDGPTAMVTLKYGPNGLPVWTNVYYGRYFPFFGFAGSYGRAVAVDRLGNVTVAGAPSVAGGPDESDIVKYDANGVGVWTNHPPASQFSELLAADANGDIIFVGASVINGGVTVKYSAAGVPLWTNNVLGGSAAGVALDSGGNALALFWAGEGFTLTKYAPDGPALWTNRYAQLGADYFPQTILTDSRDAIYVAGILAPTGPLPVGSPGPNVTTIKFSSEGALGWSDSADFPSANFFGNFVDSPLRFLSASPREVVLAQDYYNQSSGSMDVLLFEYFQPPRNSKADR